MTNANTGIQYIDIKEFTDNVKMNELDSYYPVTGDGIFDTLMETATKHLTAQYKASRIRKEDYADLYAHIYEVTLQAAMAIWLQKPEQAAKVELLNAQTEHEYVKIDQTKEQTKLIIEQQALTHEQTLHETSKRLNTEQATDLLEQQTLHEAKKILQTEAQTRLIDAQKLNTEADTILKSAQKLLIDSQKALTDSQKIHEDAKKLLTDTQKILVANQATHELSKKTNTEADTLTKFQQIKAMRAQTENTKVDTKVKEKQIRSMAVETVLKLAQTEYIKNQAKAAAKDEQVKEAQAKSEEMKANLYKRQIEGFDEDYKQKLLKIGLDSWAVGFSVSKDTFAANANQIPAAMSKVALDDLFNQAIVPEVDIKTYKTSEDIVSSSSTIIPGGPSGSGG